MSIYAYYFDRRNSSNRKRARGAGDDSRVVVVRDVGDGTRSVGSELRQRRDLYSAWEGSACSVGTVVSAGGPRQSGSTAGDRVSNGVAAVPLSLDRIRARA